MTFIHFIHLQNVTEVQARAKNIYFAATPPGWLTCRAVELLRSECSPLRPRHYLRKIMTIPSRWFVV
jgi:hypothetical protein